MEKHLLSLSVAAIACGLTASAFAGDTAVLKVQGTLSVESCTPTLSNGGVADFGKIPVSELSATEPTELLNNDGTPMSASDITLTISCGSVSNVGFTVTDNHHDSLQPEPTLKANFPITDPETEEYGLGQTAEGVNIGAYAISFINAEYDGNDTWVVASTDSGQSWLPAKNVATNQLYSLSDPTYLTKTTPFTTGDMLLRIFPMVQDTTTLNISDDTPLDGQATFTLVYL